MLTTCPAFPGKLHTSGSLHVLVAGADRRVRLERSHRRRLQRHFVGAARGWPVGRHLNQVPTVRGQQRDHPRGVGNALVGTAVVVAGELFARRRDELHDRIEDVRVDRDAHDLTRRPLEAPRLDPEPVEPHVTDGSLVHGQGVTFRLRRRRQRREARHRERDQQSRESHECIPFLGPLLQSAGLAPRIRGRRIASLSHQRDIRRPSHLQLSCGVQGTGSGGDAPTTSSPSSTGIAPLRSFLPRFSATRFLYFQSASGIGPLNALPPR